MQRLQAATQLRNLREEDQRLLDRHLQHVCDRLALEAHLERLLVVAPPVANLARNVDIRKEMHLNLEGAIAATGLATTALDVERETPLLVTARLGVGRIGVELANVIEQSRVCRRIRARRAANR